MKWIVIVLLSANLFAQDPSIRINKDQFTGITWMDPYAYSPTYPGFYLYFGQDASNSIIPLRIVIHYYGRNWIFFNEMSVIANGKTFNFAFNRYDRKDKVSNGVYEIYDYAVSDLPYCAEMLSEIDSAKEVQVRLSGDYRKDFALTYGQISIIKKYLKEYIRLAGVLPTQDKKSTPINLTNPESSSDIGVYAVFAIIVFAILLGVTLDRRRRDKEKKLLKHMSDMKIIRLAQEAQNKKNES